MADENKEPVDFDTRAKAFLTEYGELVGKHKVDLAIYPAFIPDGQGGFKITCQNTPVDMTNASVRSDFIEKEAN